MTDGPGQEDRDRMPTADEVEALVSAEPRSIADLGVAVLAARGTPMAVEGSQPVGHLLAAAGMSLSALQKVVDGLVNGGRVVEVRGRQLWDLGLPTEGTKSGGRYYLRPVSPS